MTIRDRLTKSEEKIYTILNDDDLVFNNLGLTKEQLLLKELRNIAKEYMEVEKLKKSFIKVILNNLDNLNFSEFIDFPKFYIKEKFLKKKSIFLKHTGIKCC